MSSVFKIYLFILTLCFPTTRSHYFTPCPEILTYRLQPKTNEVFGRIVIPDPPKIFRQLTLRVLYQTRENFIDNYRGVINLRWPMEETMKRIIQGEEVIYFVYFPVLTTPPTILLITLNEVKYCVGKRDLKARTVELKHNLFAPVYAPVAPSTTRTTAVPPVTKEPKVELVEDLTDTFLKKEMKRLTENCGNIIRDEKFSFRDNERLRPGQWPWLAAIFVTSSTFEFVCTGTLISNLHVLTAAHCTYYQNLQLTPNLFVVSLGRYRIDDWEEPFTDHYEVSQISLHPDYKFPKIEADIAIFKLANRVRFRPHINYLCISITKKAELGLADEFGYVAGWGDKTPAKIQKSEDIVNENSVGKLHVVPMISADKCASESENLREFIKDTEDTFCVGSQNGGSGPCNGDSGAALAVLNPLDRLFYLRGIVSMANCNHSDLVLCIDVTRYTYWILSTVLADY